MSVGSDPYLIGHRGCLVNEPENTVRAVRAAAPYVDAVEIDVRRCGSGEVVVVHDETLERVCDVDERVDELGLETLRTFGVDGTDEPIPTLKELFEAAPPSLDVNVELKETGLADDVAAVIDAVDNDAFVSSFSARALAEFRSVAPDVPRGFLLIDSWPRALEAAERLDCAFVHPYAPTVGTERVREARAEGFRVNAWEAADRDELARLREAGVDGVIVDDFRFVTEVRGESPALQGGEDVKE